MRYDNSNMPVFTATATWIWIKGLFGPGVCLLVENIHHSHTVCGWGGIYQTTKKRRTFLHSKFALFQKAHCWRVMPYKGLTDKGLHKARWLKWQTGGLEFFSAWRTHHYRVHDHIRAMIHAVKMWPWVSLVERVAYETYFASRVE